MTAETQTAPMEDKLPRERVHKVTVTDLPLHCPTPEMSLWNAHPRVFLDIKAAGGKIVCPYCGETYELIS